MYGSHTKQSIVIKRGTFEGTLYDINSLVDLPLANMRKLWKIMFDAAWENELTISLIRDWLPEKITDTKTRIQQFEDELARAKADAESKRRAVASWGSELDNRIKQAKKQLQYAKKSKKADRIELATGILTTVSQPKTEHDQAVKTVKRTESAITTAKAQLEKSEKLQTIFNEMAKTAGI